MTVSGTFTLDGTGTGGATVTVIDTDASPSTVVGTATTAADGTWSVDVGTETTLENLLVYEDESGTVHKVHNKPYVAHTTSEPSFWSDALHRYEFTEGSGTTVADTGSAGTLSDATITGGAWTTNAVHEGQAVSCDGSDDYIRAPNVSTFSGFDTGMTALGWFYHRSGSRAGLMTCYDTTNNNRSWLFETYHANGLNEYQLLLSDDGSNFYNWRWENFVVTSAWHRVGLRWTAGNDPELLYDGSVYAPDSTDTTVSSLYQSNAVLDMGRSTYTTGRFHDGIHDDAMIWDRALTDTEVQEDYDAYEVPS